MLWSLPVRAQRARVLLLIGMFADAKMAAASVRVIQSDATRGTLYVPEDAVELGTVELGAGSAVPDVDPSPPDEPLPVELVLSLPASEVVDDVSPSFLALAVRAAVERSFLAQPLPR
jgi:hypothetical protein